MKRKNPYSLIDVNQISVEALTRDRCGQAVVVGVDVAKEELVMCLVRKSKGTKIKGDADN